MTQNDLDNGRLVCQIGVAALKPAEFVIFRIGQWTADRRAETAGPRETQPWPRNATDRSRSSTSSSTSGPDNRTGPRRASRSARNIGMEVTVAEYRNGNEKENSVRKITGLNKSTDVTLKRGVVGSDNLYAWLNDIRNGDANALRTVTIQLISEDHTQTVQTWKLLRARIIKYVAGPFNAKGTDVAMEELTLAYERMEMEV